MSYLGCAPTVFLYEREVGPVTPIDGEAFQIDFDSEPDAVMEFMREGKPLPKKHRTPVSLSISREIWFGIAPMQRSYTWEPVFEKRLSFHIRGRSLHVSSYDPMIVHESKMRMSKMRDENIAHQLGWLHQFTLLPRCPGGASLSMSVSPHIDTSEWIGTEHVQRDALEDRWLIALDHFDGRSLSVDDDIDAAEGHFFYEAVDLASCTKYLDQVADPGDREFESECAGVTLNSRLWCGYEEQEAWYQDFSTDAWPVMTVVSPKGSIARAIERNLLQGDVDDRLDRVLFGTVAERIEAASEYYRQVLQSREDRIARLLNSWKKP